MDSKVQIIPLKKWMKKSSLFFFDRNPDALAAPGFVSLSNGESVKIMSAGYEPICRNTFFISCRARQILSDNLSRKVYSEDEIFKAERSINALLEKMHEYFDTRIQQGEQKLELGGFQVDEMQRIVSNYETKTVTNAVTQYLDLISKADVYLTILHYLWLTSELSDNSDECMRVKLNTEREVREHLYGVTRFAQAQYEIVRKICNGVLEKRRLEREKQSERDRLRNQEKAAEAAKKAEAKPKAKKKKSKVSPTEALLLAQMELANLSATTPVLDPA